MKPQSDIPILRVTDGEVVSGNPPAKVILSSVGTSWPNVLVEQHRIPSFEWNDVEYIQHVVGVNLGRPATTEVRKRGRFRRFYHKTGAISLFPSREPLFGRMKKEKKPPVDALFVALDPIFVSQTAAALEVYPDRVELVGQEARSDRTLRHISMALHAGLKDGRADDSIYGESLSLALAVHLLRKYAGIAMGLQCLRGGLSREKLTRATDYIQDQLESGLTVSGIAQSVHMSPYHFARLFKQSTGKSPYRYVIQARAKRAKELLRSGKFSIIEIAHRLGFADQSHLTRQLKDVFGVTPKMLQAR
jgi:AraC family transcriptional regulator